MERTFYHYGTYADALKTMTETCLEVIARERLLKTSVGFWQKIKSRCKYGRAKHRAKRAISDFVQTSLHCGVVPYHYAKTYEMLLESNDRELRLSFYRKIVDFCVNECQIVAPVNLETLYQASLE